MGELLLCLLLLCALLLCELLLSCRAADRLVQKSSETIESAPERDVAEKPTDIPETATDFARLHSIKCGESGVVSRGYDSVHRQ